MRSFKNIARLIRLKRITHPSGYSQLELSTMLGYKNGQFLSNIERGLCNIPLKVLREISTLLEICPEEIKSVMLMDQAETLDKYFSINHPKTKKIRKERSHIFY